MSARVTISNAQNRVKDSFAPAPKINVTMRANGEEQVMIMDELGSWVRAGLEVPTTAATLSTLGTAGTFTITKYWGYLFVYVAKTNYPLFENAVTGGGSVAPRSNPSPQTAANSVANTNAKQLSIPVSHRADISHIWIYRSLYFDTAAEASTFTAAGNAFWIGEVANNPNIPAVTFTDDGSIAGLEQIENDNFQSPQFDKCVYADPFFWGFGNSVWSGDVSITALGLVTIANPTVDKWFSGRDGQIITFEGITSGGIDNRGSYYFKSIDNATAQVYQDVGLTSSVGLTYAGTTRAYIRGPSTVLYRSKPRNPLSWGITDLVGALQIPSVYQFSVGGGTGTALAVVPNLNLLKLDTEKPSKTYVLNLKNAGTPNFESSLRSLSDSYCTSSHHSQFSATLDRGQNVLWSIDSKSFSIIECDGSSQLPISSQIYKTMRRLSLGSSDRAFFHGAYCPRLELNCMFIRTSGTYVNDLNLMVYQHGPTGLWGMIDVFDVLCSAQIQDPYSGQTKLFVGTSTGFVGEMFAENQVCNWFYSQYDINAVQNNGYGTCSIHAVANQIRSVNPEPIFQYPDPSLIPTDMVGIIGNWVTVVVQERATSNDPFVYTTFYCRVATIANIGEVLTFDRVLEVFGGSLQVSSFPGVFTSDANHITKFYIGLIQLEVGRSFTGDLPFDYKKIEEFWTSWKYTSTPSEPPTIEYFGTFIPEVPTGSNQIQMSAINSTLGLYTETGYYANQSKLPVDLSKVFGIIVRDRNYMSSQLMSYEIRVTPDGNTNQNDRRQSN